MGNSCGKFLWEILVGNSCGKILQEILQEILVMGLKMAKNADVGNFWHVF